MEQTKVTCDGCSKDTSENFHRLKWSIDRIGRGADNGMVFAKLGDTHTVDLCERCHETWEREMSQSGWSVVLPVGEPTI